MELTIETCQRAIEAFGNLREVLGGLSPPVLGLAGEILVWEQLLKLGIGFSPRGRQGKIDIRLTNGKGIEVRTARASDRPTGTRTWGWTVQKRSKREAKGQLYDFLICVALDSTGDLKFPEFYILPSDLTNAFVDMPLIKRFQTVKKKLWLYESLDAFDAEKEKYPEHYNEIEEDVIRNRHLYQNWNLLR